MVAAATRPARWKVFAPPLVLVLLAVGVWTARMDGASAVVAPPRTVVVVRHGRTGYVQGNRKFASVAEAPDDLLEVGLPTVAASAVGVARFRPRRILSSPTARTIHTSRVLKEAGHLEADIGLEEELREIDNYNRARFLKAVEDMRGRSLKDMTDAELSHIFVSDELHKRVAQLTPENAAFVNSVESSKAAKERAFRVLQKSRDGDVLVTHDGIACQFVRSFTPQITLTRGKYIVLQERDGVWSIIETNDEAIHLPTNT